MDFAPIARFGILLVRPGTLMMMAPGFGGQQVPDAGARRADRAPRAGARAVGDHACRRSGRRHRRHRRCAKSRSGSRSASPCARSSPARNSPGTCAASRSGSRTPRRSTRRAAPATRVLASLYGLLAHLHVARASTVITCCCARCTRRTQGLPIGAGDIDASLLTSVREVLGAGLHRRRSPGRAGRRRSPARRNRASA